MFKNWKTTLAGVLAAAAGGAGALSQQPGSVGRYAGLVGSIAALLLGVFAKDRNVTGGTVQQ